MTAHNDSVGTNSFEAIDPGLRTHMTSTFKLLGGGLLVAGFTAWLSSELGVFQAMTAADGGFSGLGYLIVFAPLVILLGGMFSGLASGSVVGASLVYWLFVAVDGVSLGFLASHYSGSSIVSAALGTAVAFGGAVLYGYTAKKDLTGFGTFMMMGLFGIIGASILNLFLGSGALQFAISIMAVVIFSGLAAWETQRLKECYNPHADPAQMRIMRIMAALGFYLDVINIFQSLLFLGGDD